MQDKWKKITHNLSVFFFHPSRSIIFSFFTVIALLISMVANIKTCSSSEKYKFVIMKFDIETKEFLSLLHENKSSSNQDETPDIESVAEEPHSIISEKLFGKLFSDGTQWYISSYYGWRRDALSGLRRYHSGVDIAASDGTPIYAPLRGIVMAVEFDSTYYGNYAIINHGNGYQTLYARMSRSFVVKGQLIEQSMQIGMVGSTGMPTYPHLHFGVYKDGRMIDPQTVMSELKI